MIKKSSEQIYKELKKMMKHLEKELPKENATKFTHNEGFSMAAYAALYNLQLFIEGKKECGFSA